MTTSSQPVDVEAYAAQFDGRPLLLRLAHIASTFSHLAPHCARIALPVLKTQTYDLDLYDAFLASLPPDERAPEEQSGWRSAAKRERDEEREKLEAELKSVSANLLKESIRITNLDLARHHLKAGDPQQALRHLVRTREFASGAGEVLEMSLGVIEVNIELRAWAQLAPYILKAESALDRPLPAGGTATSPSVPLSAAQQRARESEEARRGEEGRRVGARLGVARALAGLGGGGGGAGWERCARELLGVDGAELGEWGRTILSPSELATLLSLCALATLRRSALQSEVLASDRFRAAADEVPHVRAVVEAFVEGRYKEVLGLLEKHESQHALVPYLSPHLTNLTLTIRRRALIQYLVPFETVSLSRMALAFGLAEDVVEREVTELIRSGEVRVRVDRVSRTLEGIKDGGRLAVLAKAVEEGEKAERATRRAVVRMQLIEQGLVLSDPNRKSRPGPADEAFVLAEDFE